MTELLPCPFCGGEEIAVHPRDLSQYGSGMPHPGNDAQYLHCEGCGADGGQSFDTGQAIRLWNSRFASPPPNVAGDYFASLVARARLAADKAARKFPQPNYVTLKIAEEAGEVVRGAVHYAEGRMQWDEVEGEIVQLLAVLIRFVSEGDEVNGISPPTKATT